MTKPIRLLIAEDDPQRLELFCRLAEQLGYDYRAVNNGVAGWKLIRDAKDGEEFNLIISDNDMPVMEGIELLRLVRGNPKTKSTPFVLYSSNDTWSLKLEVSELGADFEDKAQISPLNLLKKYLPLS